MIQDLSRFELNFIWNSRYTPIFSPIEEFVGIKKKRMECKLIKNSS